MKKLMTVWIKVDADNDDALRLAETRIRAAIDEAADLLFYNDVAVDIDAIDIDIEDDKEET